jgi:hypothetical protein
LRGQNRLSALILLAYLGSILYHARKTVYRRLYTYMSAWDRLKLAASLISASGSRAGGLLFYLIYDI